MKYRFSEEAQRDLLVNVEYYESCCTGLGVDFTYEVQNTIRGVCSFPQIWPIFEAPVRRALLHRFPFGLLYTVETNNEILILAVMHLHREPQVWKERV